MQVSLLNFLVSVVTEEWADMNIYFVTHLDHSERVVGPQAQIIREPGHKGVLCEHQGSRLSLDSSDNWALGLVLEKVEMGMSVNRRPIINLVCRDTYHEKRS